MDNRSRAYEEQHLQETIAMQHQAELASAQLSVLIRNSEDIDHTHDNFDFTPI